MKTQTHTHAHTRVSQPSIERSIREIAQVEAKYPQRRQQQQQYILFPQIIFRRH